MKLKKFVAALLVLCMVLVAVPFGVSAAEADNTAEEFIKIAFVDCGRKYFTPEWIIAMIKEAKAAGYTHVQLGFGNDGLRLLLDDMSLEVNGKTFTSEQITAGIKEGNKKYHDCGEVNELTQADMDRIIDAANKIGIEIIPLVNTPGHMDAILHAMNTVGIKADYMGSVRTVDVTNPEGVAFSKALVSKYVDYFSSKGCKYFNIGADEYANDVFSGGGMGFGALSSRGQYGNFVDYINGLIAVVKGANMTPMAFNDGIYYNRNTQKEIDKSLFVCYWSSGWWGYNVASAAFLEEQGFKMVNTHGDFYYVLGKPDKFDNDFSFASGFNKNSFSGSNVNNPVGAMFCIWCDFPDAETEQVVAQKVRLPLRAMGHAMNERYDANMDQSVVPGGFNEDGSINVVHANGVTLDKESAEMHIGDTLTLTATVEPEDAVNKNVIWTSDAHEVATVENGVVTANGCGTATITVTTEDGEKSATCVITIAHEFEDATCTHPKTCKHCGATEGEALGHDLVMVPAKEATTTTEGNIEYYVCSVCGKYFSDAEGKNEISKDSVVIDKLPPVDPDVPPQVGDNSNVVLMSSVMVMSVVALGVVLYNMKRKKA